MCLITPHNVGEFVPKPKFEVPEFTEEELEQIEKLDELFRLTMKKKIGLTVSEAHKETKLFEMAIARVRKRALRKIEHQAERKNKNKVSWTS